MTQEQKDLLLKDLCGRLPYGVKGMLCEDCICTLDKVWTKKGYESVVFAGDYYDVDCFKPYLFPLSSMTEEQQKEANLFDDMDMDILSENLGRNHRNKTNIPTATYNYTDWLNKNNFDYRGLIRKGLAIDCTNLNIY